MTIWEKKPGLGWTYNIFALANAVLMIEVGAWRRGAQDLSSAYGLMPLFSFYYAPGLAFTMNYILTVALLVIFLIVLCGLLPLLWSVARIFMGYIGVRGPRPRILYSDNSLLVVAFPWLVTTRGRGPLILYNALLLALSYWIVRKGLL